MVDEYNTDDLVEEIREKFTQEQFARLKAEITAPVVTLRVEPEEIFSYTDEYCYLVWEPVDDDKIDKIRITSYSVEKHEGIKHLVDRDFNYEPYLPGSPYEGMQELAFSLDDEAIAKLRSRDVDKPKVMQQVILEEMDAMDAQRERLLASAYEDNEPNTDLAD